MKLIEALRAIQWDVETGSFKFTRKSDGICLSLYTADEELAPNEGNGPYKLIKELKMMFINWPYFSGSQEHPVPDPESKLTSFGAYQLGDENKSMWEGEYGKLRLDLLRFCIAQLEREYASN